MGEEPPEELPPMEFDANPPTGFSPYPYMEEPTITEPVEGTVWAVGTEHELVCSPPYVSDTLARISHQGIGCQAAFLL
jgi:hypothetical protein